MSDPIQLDPNDPFEKVVYDMVMMNRRKRADYASKNDVIANFRWNANMVWFADWDAFMDCYSMVTRKIGRIQNLLKNNAVPQNESIKDTLIDLAVYSVLLILCWEERQHG